MAEKQRDGGAESDQQARRKAKLAAQLRANLLKRKAQARSRREGEADDRSGIEPGEKPD